MAKAKSSSRSPAASPPTAREDPGRYMKKYRNRLLTEPMVRLRLKLKMLTAEEVKEMEEWADKAIAARTTNASLNDDVCTECGQSRA